MVENIKSFEEDSEFKLPVQIEQYERKIYDLKQLIEVSKGLNSNLEYNTLIESILLTCMGQMQLLNAGIFVKKGLEQDVFSLHRNYKGFEIEHDVDFTINADSKVLSFVENENLCYTVEELKQNVDDKKTFDVFDILKPALVVPLKSKGLLHGVIILANRISGEVFSKEERDYLLNIGSMAGIAIYNAFLYEMATTDMMTKLKIHHFFHTSLSEEIERSKKYEKPLTLIMIDIDHFKIFNDDHGHLAGDLVLKNVADLIKRNIRPMDIASRYGGEEFGIVLPKTDIHEALIVAERIRLETEVEIVQFELKKLKVTISVGVTQFDSEIDLEKSDFIKRADKALYLSKDNGRNRVTLL